MAWTTLTNAQTDQDSPITQTLIQALRDNVAAMGAADSGAPNIRVPDVLRTPAAGAVVVLELAGANELRPPNATTAYDTSTDARQGTTSSLGVTVLVAGVIRVVLDHARITANGSSEVDVLKNGSIQSGWTQASTSFASRSVDITVAKGDIVVIRQRNTNASGTTAMKNVQIQADANDMVVI